MEYWILLVIIGIVAGILAGMLGVGGGVVLVPGLVYLFRDKGIDESIVLHLALGTSLSVIIFNAIASILSHHKHRAIIWPIALRFTPGLLIGTFIGSLLASLVSTFWLQVFFSTFAFFVGLRLINIIRTNADIDMPGRQTQVGISGIIGALSALLGIGGGSFTVPFLTLCKVPVRQAVATSAVCGFPIAIAGTLGYLASGWNHSLLPEQAMGFIYLPALIVISLSGMLSAPFGAYLAHNLPVDLLKKLFGLLLLVLSIKMLFSE